MELMEVRENEPIWTIGDDGLVCIAMRGTTRLSILALDARGIEKLILALAEARSAFPGGIALRDASRIARTAHRLMMGG